jgi:hypothetical protein
MDFASVYELDFTLLLVGEASLYLEYVALTMAEHNSS